MSKSAWSFMRNFTCNTILHKISLLLLVFSKRFSLVQIVQAAGYFLEIKLSGRDDQSAPSSAEFKNEWSLPLLHYTLSRRRGGQFYLNYLNIYLINQCQYFIVSVFQYLREGDHLEDPGVDGRIILSSSGRFSFSGRTLLHGVQYSLSVHPKAVTTQLSISEKRENVISFKL